VASYLTHIGQGEMWPSGSKEDIKTEVSVLSLVTVSSFLCSVCGQPPPGQG
jgi:hypothetical protein